MKIGVLNETNTLERRVALIPDVAGRLVEEGHTVAIESGAGQKAGFADHVYKDSGVAVHQTRSELLAEVDLLLTLGKPEPECIDQLKEGTILIGFLQPLADLATVKRMNERKITALAMELLPRITRAQFMDALSSMATVAGYKAVLIAANALPRFFPMLTTAAGTIKPAKVIVIGAGVAGLQAIATARRLGAEVVGYDVRAAAGEQIQSLGARFEPMEVAHAEDEGGYAKELSPDFYKEEQELIRKHSPDADAIISTAQIPGKKAPLLITKAMVEEMRAGSAIVDLAAAAGGNCELTRPDEVITYKGVSIFGHTNLPAMMPEHASQLYSRNLHALIRLLCTEGGQGAATFEDEVVKGALVCMGGHVNHPMVLKALA
ncbi:MAG: Re/Si-specific NAD(P)(+) transhydrogenase subunit alpha [Verrucomicrobiia bacterium]